MTVATVKRSQFKTFINTTPSAAATYSLLGDGVTTSKINYNPQTVEEIYVHQDSGNTEVESYKPTMPVEATAKKGDGVFDFVDTIRKGRKVLADTHTDIINVWLYETPTVGAYPAEKQNVAIQVEDFGGDGGSSAKVNYTINYLGDPILGTFNPTTLAWTPS